MKIKDAYKLKRFGTYILEVDTDETEKIRKLSKQLKKLVRWRFIKFIVVPMGAVKLKEIKGRRLKC